MAATNVIFQRIHETFRRLDKHVDGASLALFRIVFGLAMAWDTVPYFLNGWISAKFLDPSFHFPYFQWLQPISGSGLYFIFGLIFVSGLFVAFGFLYRLASICQFLAFTYVFLLDRTEYLNHFYLMCLISFILVFVPANRVWSIDRRMGWCTEGPGVPVWTLYLLRFQIFLVYFFAGIAKIEGDWLSGVTTFLMLQDATNIPVIGRFHNLEWWAIFVAWSSMVLDLCVVFLLIWRKSRWMAFIGLSLFHLTNSVWLNIGVFPWLMLAVVPIFFEPDWARRIANRLFKQPRIQTNAKESIPKRTEVFLKRAFLVYIVFQVLVPLRHYCYQGNTSWTMNGNNFSWRMKMSVKSGDAIFKVRRPVSGEVFIVPAFEFIRPTQYDRMIRSPHLIRQYAEYLSREYEEEGQPAMVKVLTRITMNGREPQPCVKPDIDLAKVSGDSRGKAWILPLMQPRPSLEELRKERIQR